MLCKLTLMSHTACEENTYGYRCGRVCDCENGDCDPVDGCMCHEGYNGTHCETGVYRQAMYRVCD